MNVRSLVSFLVFCVLALVSTAARAQDLHQAARDLGGPDKTKLAAAVELLARSSDPAALSLLEALAKDSLRIDAAGTPFVAREDGQLSRVFAGGSKPSGALST